MCGTLCRRTDFGEVFLFVCWLVDFFSAIVKGFIALNVVSLNNNKGFIALNVVSLNNNKGFIALNVVSLKR